MKLTGFLKAFAMPVALVTMLDAQVLTLPLEKSSALDMPEPKLLEMLFPASRLSAVAPRKAAPRLSTCFGRFRVLEPALSALSPTSSRPSLKARSASDAVRAQLTSWAMSWPVSFHWPPISRAFSPAESAPAERLPTPSAASLLALPKVWMASDADWHADTAPEPKRCAPISIAPMCSSRPDT